MADNTGSGCLPLKAARGITETREDKIEFGSGSVQTKNLLNLRKFDGILAFSIADKDKEKP